jgi:hypothetical protein
MHVMQNPDTLITPDGSQVVLQDQGNWSYTSQKIDPECPTCGLNNGNTGWVEQFQAGVQSYQLLLKAAEISLTVSAALLSGSIGAGASFASTTASTTLTGGRVFWSGGNTAKTTAAEFAQANGMQTLEMTTTGSIMNTLSPYLPKSITRPIWNKLSASFAKGATGDINVFQNTAGIAVKSTWAKIEFPILRDKNIIYHLVK